MKVQVRRPRRFGSRQSQSGKAQVSTPIAVVIVIVAVLVIGYAGWFFAFRDPNAGPAGPGDTRAIGSAAGGTASGGGVAPAAPALVPGETAPGAPVDIGIGGGQSGGGGGEVQGAQVD